MTDIGNEPLHLALILAADGPRLLTAAPTRPALLERVAGYVARYAPHQLWPDDAAYVFTLLDGGHHERAIRHYFDADRRWDREELQLSIVEVDEAAATASAGAADIPA